MRKKSLAFVALAAGVSALVCSCRRPADRALAITHVTLIDATGAPAKLDVTVVVAEGKIAAVGAAEKIRVPSDARIVEDRGRFLIPGLADMHVHLTGAGEPAGSRKFILPLLIANGITTVRDMGGKLEYLVALRHEIESGERLGPQIVFAGPYVDGEKPGYLPAIVARTADEGRKAVDQLVAEKVDFIKVQSQLNREAYFAVADESRKQHIRFAGHVPDSVSPLEAAQAGQSSIEHLTGVLLGCSSREEELRKRQTAAVAGETAEQAMTRERKWQQDLLDSYSEDKAEALVKAFVNNGTWQVPTFPILIHMAFVTPKTDLERDARMKFVPQNEKKIWSAGTNGQLQGFTEEDFALREKIVGRSMEIVGKMQAAGVRIMAGTDMAAPNVFPGSSLHEDLAYLVEAGLSPMQALQAATKNPAQFLGRLPTQGTIEQGKIADLVLLDADPLVDIRNTQKINAVILRGKLLDRKALDDILAKEEKFAAK